jgi:uncharacterized membrane protein
MAGILWVIGCCMVLMVGFVKLLLSVTAAAGMAIIAAHKPNGPASISAFRCTQRKPVFRPVEDPLLR